MDMSYYPGTYANVDDTRIREGYRLRVIPDDDAEDPRGWGEHVTTDSPEYKRWAAGDVYGVILERLEWYINELTGNRRSVWEDVDSLWGCYLAPDYTAVTVARHYFCEGTTDDE